MTNDEQRLRKHANESIRSAEDDFNHEFAQTCRNAELMALLNERGKQSVTIPLDEVKRQLGLSSQNRSDHPEGCGGTTTKHGNGG